MDKKLLGGLSAREFLADYWQKKPLLIRGAIPEFRNLLSLPELFDLAGRDDCESRLITGSGKKWTLEHGPFDPRDLGAMPRRNWTILVQGLNTLLPAADALMRRFAFVPYARLDDLMVSYAVQGGSVGPHVDSYDVFLLQGEGRRRWRISGQRDLDLDPRAPLKLLRDFRPEQEWVLETGDMLYLPPHIAHEGTALDPCMTYSIGFRAPSAQELSAQFLGFLQERVQLEGMYADPDLRLQSDPARISDDFLHQIAAMLGRIRWGRSDIEAFVGQYLSEPKAHIQFQRPERPLNRKQFERTIKELGLHLSPFSLMLYRGHSVYLNGEARRPPETWRAALRKLANNRTLEPGGKLASGLIDLLYEWYEAGYVQLGHQNER